MTPTGRRHSQRPSRLFFVTCQPLTRCLPELKVTWKCFLSTVCTASSELQSGHDSSHVPSETLNEAQFSAPLGASLHRPPGPSDSGGTGGGAEFWTGSLTCRPCTPPQALSLLGRQLAPCAPQLCVQPLQALEEQEALPEALPSQRSHTCC